METKREGTYKLDELTLNDILHQIYRIREWFLYLTKDEHLSRTAKNSWEGLGLDFASEYVPSGKSLAGTCTPSSSHSHPLGQLSSS